MLNKLYTYRGLTIHNTNFQCDAAVSTFFTCTFSILMYSNKEVSLPDKNNYVTLYEAIVCGGDDVTRVSLTLQSKAVIIPF